MDVDDQALLEALKCEQVIQDVMTRLAGGKCGVEDLQSFKTLGDADKNRIIDFHQALYRTDKNNPVFKALFSVIPEICDVRWITRADLDANPDLLQAMEDGELVHRQDKQTIYNNRVPPGESGTQGQPRCLPKGLVFDKQSVGIFRPGSVRPLTVVYGKLSNQLGSRLCPDDHLPENVRDYLDEKAHVIDVRSVDTVAFYSISNFLDVRGVTFGKRLITGATQVISDMIAGQQLDGFSPPEVRFCTLSPVSAAIEENNFIPWLVSGGRSEPRLLTPEEIGLTRQVVRYARDFGGYRPESPVRIVTGAQAAKHLAALLCHPELFAPEGTEGSILGNLKRRDLLTGFDRLVEDLSMDYAISSNASHDPSKFKAIDDAASFHWTNGAAFAGVHARANNTEDSCRKSGGTMFNHLYDLDAMEARANAHRKDGVIFLTPSMYQRFMGRMEALGRDLSVYDARLQQIDRGKNGQETMKSCLDRSWVQRTEPVKNQGVGQNI